jgi:8-amino-7-oxononanoate synthase
LRNFENIISEELSELKKRNLYRKLAVLSSGCHKNIKIKEKLYLNFCSNNYLSLNGHTEIEKSIISALKKWGTSSGASRLIAGDLKIFEIAEKKLAQFKGTETSLIFSSGYQANVAVISTLAGDGDVIFSDELNHASIIDGCRLSKAKVCIYRHCDMNDLEKKLKKEKGKKRLIITDSIFSMDGDLAPIRDIVELAERYDCGLIIDDAHATGVLGKEGRGSIEYFGLENKDVMVLATGGKALGVMGAFFCCSKKVREYLINKCRGFIYSTGPSPAVPAGLLASISLVKKENWRRDKLRKLSEYLWNGFRKLNYNTSKTPSHILPLIVRDNEKALKLADAFMKNGIFVRAIRPPTVPENTARIRFSLMTDHEIEDIEKIIQTLEKTKII